jgi:hypothetical protein
VKCVIGGDDRELALGGRRVKRKRSRDFSANEHQGFSNGLPKLDRLGRQHHASAEGGQKFVAEIFPKAIESAAKRRLAKAKALRCSRNAAILD